jgi:predicted phage terminase large subunit-like protein
MTAVLARYAVELESEHRRRQRAPRPVIREPFGRWIAKARPEFHWDALHFTHPAGIFAALDRVTAGEIRRLILSIAVRHGKTETLISYGAQRLEYDPRFRILIGSYNQQQADKLSRQVRNLVRHRGVALSEDRDAAREWDTVAGGGVQAVGAGAGVASVNADLIIIDDPIGSRDEAESQADRDRVWDWITNDILARCVPSTAVIVSHPRWHQDDPIGRLRDRQKRRWHVVDLPGRAERKDPLGRAKGAPLWPEQRGEEWLEEKREELGEYGFASLVQGRPRPREGGMFKWKWWRLLDAVPAEGRMIRYWDLAGTQQKKRQHDPDYTAGALLCRMTDNRTAIVDVERFRKSVAARDAQMEEVCRADLAAYPNRIRWWIETESGIAGEERTADLVRRLQACGMPVSTEHPTGSKVDRAEPLSSAAEAGNILLCPGEWRDPFRSEAADFPTGQHDDQVDGASGAYAKLGYPTVSALDVPAPPRRHVRSLAKEMA